MDPSRDNLKDLADRYKSNVATLKRLMGEYNIDLEGLEAVLEAREDLVFGDTVPEGPKKHSIQHPAVLILSLNGLCDAYNRLGKDKERFSDFVNKFDEYTSNVAGILEGHQRKSARSLPDALLRLGLSLIHI